MSRNEEFWTGKNPEEIHPNLNPRMSAKHVGFVDTQYLLGMRGNNIRDWDQVRRIRQDLREGRGISHPLEVDQDVVGDGNAYVGEGNHRLAAAALEGVPYVPVTMYRKKIGRNSDSWPRFPGRRLPGKGEMWDEFYHPEKAFPKDKVWPQGEEANLR